MINSLVGQIQRNVRELEMEDSILGESNTYGLLIQTRLNTFKEQYLKDRI
jgi:hypothetical protein